MSSWGSPAIQVRFSRQLLRRAPRFVNTAMTFGLNPKSRSAFADDSGRSLKHGGGPREVVGRGSWQGGMQRGGGGVSRRDVADGPGWSHNQRLLRYNTRSTGRCEQTRRSMSTSWRRSSDLTYRTKSCADGDRDTLGDRIVAGAQSGWQRDRRRAEPTTSNPPCVQSPRRVVRTRGQEPARSPKKWRDTEFIGANRQQDGANG